MKTQGFIYTLQENGGVAAALRKGKIHSFYFLTEMLSQGYSGLFKISKKNMIKEWRNNHSGMFLRHC